MLDVRKLLAQRPLLFDGGMGTYYKAKPGQECEQANLTDPEGILAVHRAYLAAGADAIKTNTFSLPRLAAAQQPGWEQLAAGSKGRRGDRRGSVCGPWPRTGYRKSPGGAGVSCCGKALCAAGCTEFSV